MGRRVVKSESDLETVYVEVDGDGNEIPGSTHVERKARLRVDGAVRPMVAVTEAEVPSMRRVAAVAAAAGGAVAGIIEAVRAIF